MLCLENKFKLELVTITIYTISIASPNIKKGFSNNWETAGRPGMTPVNQLALSTLKTMVAIIEL